MKKTDHEFEHYLDFEPKCILEAGVGMLSRSRSRQFWATARCIMFEPLPEYYQKLAVASFPYVQVKVYPFALWDHSEGVELVQHTHCSYVKGVVSRNPLGEAEAACTITVPSVRLDAFDTGDYDLVLLDMEAAEWSAIKYMKSRPKLISIEMWSPDLTYRHSHYAEITAWLNAEGYTEVGCEVRDSFFIK